MREAAEISEGPYLPRVMGKSAYAAYRRDHLGRRCSPAYISKLIARGKLHGPALVGEGLKAKIDRVVADEQLAAIENPYLVITRAPQGAEAARPQQASPAPPREEKIAPVAPGGEGQGEDGAGLNELQRQAIRERRARAEKAELELGRQRGELAEVAAVGAMAEEIGLALIAHLDERRDELAERLAHKPAVEISGILADADLIMRHRLADEIEQRVSELVAS